MKIKDKIENFLSENINGGKKIDHVAYPQKLRTKSPSELRYIIKDAKEALQAMPNGKNAGYYQDEINYCANELYRRQKGGK